MKRIALLAAVGALGLATSALAAPASAAPLPLIKASYWCGPGWHPNAWGRCVPNYYGWGYWRPAYWGPGFHGRVFERRGFHEGFRGGFRGGYHR